MDNQRGARTIGRYRKVQSRKLVCPELFRFLTFFLDAYLSSRDDIANHYVKTNAAGKKRACREMLEHYDRFYLHGALGRATISSLKRPDDQDSTVPLSVSVEDSSEDWAKAVAKGKRGKSRRNTSFERKIEGWSPSYPTFGYGPLAPYPKGNVLRGNSPF